MDSNKPTSSTQGVVVVASTNRLPIVFAEILFKFIEMEIKKECMYFGFYFLGK